MLRHKDTNIILTGGVDDIWQHKITKKLVVVEYKSQAKNGRVDKQDYLDDPFHEGYKIQMDFYAYLLSGMGFEVDQTAYFLVCNAKRDDEDFNKRMNFDEYLIPYNLNIDWIEEKIDSMVACMNNENIPESNLSCKNCAYSEQYSKLICNPVKDNKQMKINFD